MLKPHQEHLSSTCLSNFGMPELIPLLSAAFDHGKARCYLAGHVGAGLSHSPSSTGHRGAGGAGTALARAGGG